MTICGGSHGRQQCGTVHIMGSHYHSVFVGGNTSYTLFRHDVVVWPGAYANTCVPLCVCMRATARSITPPQRSPPL